MKNQYPESLTLNIVNWDKYNARRDGHRSWWFKVSNDIFMDSKFRLLTPFEKSCYLLLLTFASKNASNSFTTRIKLDANLLGSTRPSQYYQAVMSIVGTGLVRLEKNRIEEKRIEERSGPKKRKTAPKEKTKSDDFDKPPSVASPTSLFIPKYIEAFQKRFGTQSRPDLSGRVLGQIKRLVGDVGLERSTNLVEKYFDIEDRWFQTKCYDFSTFIENIQKVSLALDGCDNVAGPKYRPLTEEDIA